jgi:hypothetical protein
MTLAMFFEYLLENSTSKYAAEAIKFDSQDSKGLAIQAYPAISRLQTEQDLYAKG